MKPHFQNLEETLRVLATSANEAVVPVLLAALDSDDVRVREGVFPILLQRRSAEAENEILRRWPELSGHWKRLVIRRDEWLAPAIRSALLGDDLNTAMLACEAAADLRDYELIPVLVSAICKQHSEVSHQAAGALLTLAERLAEEVSTPRDYRIRKDAKMQRAQVLGSLEKGVQSFGQHERPELIESLLILASRDNAVVSRILQEPAERAFVPTLDLLKHSPRPGILRFLLSYLDDPLAPLPALHAIGRRRDITFLRQLCRKIGDDPRGSIRNNLKRIEKISWLRSQRFLLDALHESEEPGAVQLITLSGVSRPEALESLAHLLRNGKPQGRRAASAALVDFVGDEANALVQFALEDQDPTVRANLAGQLRTRGITGSMKRLVTMLESPHEVERQAAHKALEEFNFASYVAIFDYLDEETRESTGKLVRQIDEHSTSLLREELCSTSRMRKRRGLEMALPMGLVLELQEVIAALTRDDDQYIRLEAVRLLGICPTEISGEVLREALTDTRPLVQEAAERGLRELNAVDTPHATESARADVEISRSSENLTTA